MASGTCSLCKKDCQLVISHIIPKFVINLLKTKSRLRSHDSPNKRVQDGKKSPLLCSSCEELLSAWERSAYKDIFLPLSDSSRVIDRIQYGPWALKFAVSVSWRVLLYHFSRYGLPYLTNGQRAKANEALETWRRFLLGELPNPGQFEQHLLPLNVITQYHGLNISPFMNRYIMLTLDMGIPYSNRSVTIYSKMGNILLFGLVQKYAANRWKGTKLHANSGSIVIPGTYVIPTEVPEFINERANKTASLLASLSDKQRKIISNAIIQDIDRIADSDIFLAMQHDLLHSGKEALRVTESRKHS